MKSQDPYEPDARMPEGRWIKGRYRAQKIDTAERRPLRILRGAEAEPYSPKDGETVAANFTHDGRFWIAKFPRNAVKRVIFQKWDFGEMRVPLLDFQIFHIRTWRSRVFKRAPHFPEVYLWARRLLKSDGGSRMPSLNEEKKEWRDTPRMRARKSEYLESRRRERGASS